MSDSFPDAADFLRGTIIGALKNLSKEYEETPLEAAEHLQAIIIGAVTRKVQYASLYDEALATPKLLADLRGPDTNVAIARRWGTTEVAVRRTKQKLSDQGII